MSHHASGPNFGFPRGDARLGLTICSLIKSAKASSSVRYSATACLICILLHFCVA